jgi:uncharacterized protein
MLGSLARWLRLLGFDCAYEPHIADADLVRRGIDEQRVILTRDRRLAEEWSVDPIHLVSAERVFDQLREVVDRFDLPDSLSLFTRCSRCNVELRELDAAAAAERVPPAVHHYCVRFVECPSCLRVYWEGGHAERMRALVAGLRDDEP